VAQAAVGALPGQGVAFGEVGDAEAAEYVEALGAVVHAVGGDVEEAGSGERDASRAALAEGDLVDPLDVLWGQVFEAEP
jgi:hypothetical protein